MNITTQTAKAIVLGAVVVALAAPVTQAGTKLPPDPGLGGRAGYNIIYRDQLRAASAAPVTRAGGIVDDYFRDQPQALPDVFERYVVAHPYGRGLVSQAASPVQRIIAQELGRRYDPRLFGPGVAVAAAAQPVQVVVRGGFDWGDFGIGAASGAGLLLLLGGLCAGALAIRQRGDRLKSA